MMLESNHADKPWRLKIFIDDRKVQRIFVPTPVGLFNKLALLQRGYRPYDVNPRRWWAGKTFSVSIVKDTK